MGARRNQRLRVGSELGKVLARKFAGDPIAMADILGVIPQRADLRPRTLIFLPRIVRGGVGMAMLPRVADPQVRRGMLASAVALHLDSRIGESALMYADGEPLFDAERVERVRLFALAFAQEGRVRRIA